MIIGGRAAKIGRCAGALCLIMVLLLTGNEPYPIEESNPIEEKVDISNF